jgi:hypothetical protein
VDQTRHRSRYAVTTWTTAVVLLVAGLLVPPAASSVTPGDQDIRFDSVDTIRYTLTVRFAAADAQLLRAMFNTDKDRHVSPAEVQAADQDIARYFPSTAPPLVDGRFPVNTTYDPSNIQGAVGPSNASTPIIIRLNLVHLYKPDQANQHTVTLLRAPVAQESLYAEVTIHAPPAYVITDMQGFPPGMTRSPDGMNLTGVMGLQGPTNATLTFQLDSKWNAGGVPSLAMPAVMAAVMGAAAILLRRRRMPP